MKTIRNIVSFVLCCALLSSCSRSSDPHQFAKAPLLVPSFDAWPSNVVHAVAVLKESRVPRERDVASGQIDGFFRHLARLSPDNKESQNRPMRKSDVIRVFGKPDGDVSHDNVLFYKLAHHSGSDTVLMFAFQRRRLVDVFATHFDGPPCSEHDHSDDEGPVDEKTQTSTEPANAAYRR